jgi:hypothetical protein
MAFSDRQIKNPIPPFALVCNLISQLQTLLSTQPIGYFKSDLLYIPIIPDIGASQITLTPINLYSLLSGTLTYSPQQEQQQRSIYSYL